MRCRGAKFVACTVLVMAIQAGSTAAQSSYFSSSTELYSIDTQQITAVQTVDVDADGDLDLVAGRRYENKVSVRLNDGYGQFGPEILTMVDAPVISIAVADFDNDGVPDLASSNHVPFIVSVRLGNGDGTFYLPPTPTLTSTTNNGIVAGDFDGDTWNDLAIINSTTGASTIRIYLNDGVGPGSASFTFDAQYPVGDRPQARHTVVWDFDGMNGPDLAVLSGEQQRVTLLRNDGSGGFGSLPAIQITGLLYGGAALRIADLDNDGDMDLVATSNNSHGYSVMLNTSGDGQAFSVANHQPPGWNLPAGFDIGDVDEDGVVDLVVSDYGAASATYVLLGNGDGTFPSSPNEVFTYPGAGPPGTPLVADFAPGGELDLAVATQGTGGFYVQTPEVPEEVDLTGTVTPDCPGAVEGIAVTLFDDSGGLVSEVFTDASGSYEFLDLLPDSYHILVVTPLGYEYVPPAYVELTADDVQDFAMYCVTYVWDTRGQGFWKANVAKHLKGHHQGTQVSEAELLTYAQLIYDRFYSFPSNAVDIEGITFVMQGGNPIPLDLQALDDALDLHQATMLERAERQYLTLLLNVASGRIGLNTIVSEDGHICSEVVTYVAEVLADGDGSNDEFAKDIAETINDGVLVGGGALPSPELIANWAYQMLGSPVLPGGTGGAVLGLVYPNPTRGAAMVQLDLPRSEHVRIDVFDATGRLLRTPYEGFEPSGRISVMWECQDDKGRSLPAGTYYIQLSTQGRTETQKVAVVR